MLGTRIFRRSDDRARAMETVPPHILHGVVVVLPDESTMSHPDQYESLCNCEEDTNGRVLHR